MKFLSFFIIPLFLFLLSYPSFSLFFYDMNFIWCSLLQYIGYNKLIRTLEPMRIVSDIFIATFATYFPRFDLRRIVPWIYTSRLKTSGKRMNVHLLRDREQQWNMTRKFRPRECKLYQTVDSISLFLVVFCSSRITDRLI